MTEDKPQQPQEPQGNVPPNLPTGDILEKPKVEPTPIPEPIQKVAPIPTHNKPIEPVELAEPKEVEKETPIPENIKEESSLRTIRTYKDDLAQVIGKKKESFISIATAENKRRVKSGVPLEDDDALKRQHIKKIGIIVLSTMLFVIGTGSIFYFYGKSGTEAVEPDSKIPSIIFSDEEEEFEITNLSRRQILNGLTALKDRARLSIGRVENVFITKSFIDEEGIEGRELVSASDFLNAINAQLPTSFLRSLEPLFMFGVHMFDGNQPFLVFKNSFYENTFAGMLGWERDMKEDLAPLFGPAKFDVIVSEDTGTSTPPLVIPTFGDFVIRNKDVRALKDSNGEIVLLYSFIDKSTIVITTNENTFSEVFTRMTSSRTLR